ncbi:transposase [Providencia heimbachae]|uniref:Rpn family recombination-promoting nuclease/putative transposase n=1 Tax=Providencia heimbachae TaxID=333962 RepID=UPI0010BF1134|nr:Rpn family recombination-promoting nuclease/putative transposase [Providencia heimbachae]QCJ71373.1 transposase [Providencia heimbachae]
MVKNQSSAPHDSTFKSFMSKIDNARDFFDIHLPEHIKKLCDFNTLTLTNSSFIDKQLRSRLSDVLYSVETELNKGYIYLLIEHQSTPDKLMSWRLMHYAFLAMNQHLQQGHRTLPLIVPVLFYHGSISPYPYAQTWTHCFPWPDIASELYFNPFPLVDVTVIDDNELINHRKIAVMELAMKHKDLREDINKVTSLLAQALNQHYNSDDDIVTVFNYLFVTLDSPNFDRIIKQLINQTENHQEVIMNIAQRLINQGRQEGIEIGIQEGVNIGRKEERKAMQQEIALNSLKNGATIEFVCKITGLSRKEVLSLQ